MRRTLPFLQQAASMLDGTIMLIMDPLSTVVSSGKVVTWNGPTNLTQSDTTRQASYTSADAAFNNQPVAVFSGLTTTAKYYDFPALNSLTQGEVFAVLSATYGVNTNYGNTAHPSVQYTGLWHLNNSGSATHYPYIDAHLYDGVGSARRDNGDMSGPLVDNLCAPHIYNVSAKSAEYIARLNGGVIHSSGGGGDGQQFNNTNGRFGSDSSLTFGFNGKLAYLILVNTVQTTQKRLDFTSYLQSRFFP